MGCGDWGKMQTLGAKGCWCVRPQTGLVRQESGELRLKRGTTEERMVWLAGGKKTGSENTKIQPQERRERGKIPAHRPFPPSLPGEPRPPPAPAKPRPRVQAHLGAAGSSPAATSPSSIPAGGPHTAKHNLCVPEGGTYSLTAGPPRPGRGRTSHTGS